MCGTANHNSEYGHGHLRVSAADTAAYEYLAKETTARQQQQQKTAVPAPAVAKQKKPLDSLSVMTAVTKSAVDKCASIFGEVQKSPAYK